MLINSSYYESGQKISDIAPDAIQIQKAVPGFYWLAYEQPDDATVNQLANQFELPVLAAEDVRHASQYPKLEEYDDTRRLAAWAAIFAVPTIFSGVWGMNFQHMPELQWEFGYPLSLLGMFGITIWLHKRLKQRGWL